MMARPPRHALVGTRRVDGHRPRANRGQAVAGRLRGTGESPPRPAGGATAVAAAQLSFRKSVSAMSTFSRSAVRTAGQSFFARSSVFHEYKCFGLWKSLLAT
jgi:hypothetical protein